MERAASKFIKYGLRYLVLFGVLVAAKEQKFPDIPEDCGECIPEDCRKIRTCVAGVMLDRCHCCKVCAKSEYELCEHAAVPGSERHGVCGENLECRLRNDLLADEGPEALCYCLQNEAVCGDDGETQVTYNNHCQMTAVVRSRGVQIDVVGKGPCDATPEIVTPPENTHNRTGDNVVLACEARGFPIPTVEWSWMRVDGQTEFLPNDDVHVSVNMRGGPERFTVTGWLQIMDVQKYHEGDYTCVAQNKQGMSEATARVKISETGPYNAHIETSIQRLFVDRREERKRRRKMNRENDL